MSTKLVELSANRVVERRNMIIDEGITPMDTNKTHQVDIQCPITRARARQLNL
jgi:hypothetical protein